VGIVEENGQKYVKCESNHMTDFAFTTGTLEIIEYVVEDFEKTIEQSNLNVVLSVDNLEELMAYSLW